MTPTTAVTSPFLRRVIALDAAACAASGLLLAFGGARLADLTGLPAALSRPAGVFLLVWAALLAWIATRPAFNRAVVWTLIGVNAVWVLESVMVLALQWVRPTPFGYAFVIAQAIAVAVIADLQFIGLKRGIKTLV
jgi:hypothetical protein